jgi:hypothetical protein
MIFKILIVSCVLSALGFSLWKFYQMVRDPKDGGDHDVMV